MNQSRDKIRERRDKGRERMKRKREMMGDEEAREMREYDRE